MWINWNLYGGAGVKNPLANVRHGFDPWVGVSPGVGNGNQSRSLAWKIHGQRGLVGYSSWSHEELDTPEHTHTYNAGGNFFFIYFY